MDWSDLKGSECKAMEECQEINRSVIWYVLSKFGFLSLPPDFKENKYCEHLLQEIKELDDFTGEKIKDQVWELISPEMSADDADKIFKYLASGVYEGDFQVNFGRMVTTVLMAIYAMKRMSYSHERTEFINQFPWYFSNKYGRWILLSKGGWDSFLSWTLKAELAETRERNLQRQREQQERERQQSNHDRVFAEAAKKAAAEKEADIPAEEKVMKGAVAAILGFIGVVVLLY